MLPYLYLSAFSCQSLWYRQRGSAPSIGLVLQSWRDSDSRYSSNTFDCICGGWFELTDLVLNTVGEFSWESLTVVRRKVLRRNDLRSCIWN